MQSRHKLTEPGYFKPLLLDSRGRATLRYKLLNLIDTYNNAAQAGLSQISLAPRLLKAKILQRQVVSQELCVAYGMETVKGMRIYNCAPQAGLGYVPDTRIVYDDLVDSGPGSIPWLPAYPDMNLLAHHAASAPWLPWHPNVPGAMNFQSFYPRAVALVYLHAMVNTGTVLAPVFKNIIIAKDRHAGRLHHLAYWASKIPEGVALQMSENSVYPIVQMFLSNEP